MKVQELIEFVGNSKNKMLKPEQLQSVLKKKLEIKKYIGIKEKKQLVDNIVNACILYENGVFKFDDIEKYICFTMKTIEAYTNIELSDDIEEDYDLLCQHNLLNIIVEMFGGEYDNVNLLLQMKCDYILSDNNIEAQIGRFLNDILEKVDDLSNALQEKIEGFDISKLPIGKKDLNKLIEFINSQK